MNAGDKITVAVLDSYRSAFNFSHNPSDCPENVSWLCSASPGQAFADGYIRCGAFGGVRIALYHTNYLDQNKLWEKLYGWNTNETYSVATPASYLAYWFSRSNPVLDSVSYFRFYKNQKLSAQGAKLRYVAAASSYKGKITAAHVNAGYIAAFD